MIKIITPSNTVELICLIIAIFCLAKDKSLFWKIAIIYMAITFTTETVASIMSKIFHQYNVWLYNLYILVEDSFVSYGLYKFLKEYTNPKPIIIVGSGLMFISYCFDLYSHGIAELHNITINVSAIIFVVYGLYYFLLLLKDDNFIRLKFHPQFWWVVGVLFYYFGGTIINLFNEVLFVKVSTSHYLRWYIYILLNLLLYSFWSYSFICRARQRRLHL
ncbi:hypothetical protein [Pedobacter paludis]|uniref:Uncharacterized protein n=1 Tax=Pedobacter paludis TaxID=2203212 RepID=A0A317EYM8_9SPHI|nr:hypothetical protein [Pedobacter paludis]PWS32080.1 hypothetical protein DF947_09905 [Pedobacter paludis]